MALGEEIDQQIAAVRGKRLVQIPVDLVRGGNARGVFCRQ